MVGGSFRFSPATIASVRHFSNFTALRNFLKVIHRIANTDESHFGQKTSILRGRRRWSDFSKIFGHCNYEDFSFFQVYGSTELLKKYFPESPLPTSRILVGKPSISMGPDCGRISA